MLTLSRYIDQSAVLYTKNGEITVTLKETGSGRLALAFDAPQSVRILRAELAEGIENIELIDTASEA